MDDKKRMGKRNPLELFNKPDSGIEKQETGIINPENIPSSGEETEIIEKTESGIMNQENTRLYNLSIRVPESLNDALDDAVKITRRTIGQKIRKERLVTLAIEAMLEKVEKAGGWKALKSEEELRKMI